MKKKGISTLFINPLYVALLVISLTSSAQMQKLEIAPNNRFIVTEDGQPFVWIGETNWFFAKLPPETIDSVLNVRKKQGFTILFVSCRENLYTGESPGKITTPNEAWWSYLDEYINKCEKGNLYVGITLGWWGLVNRYNEQELFEYGRWVGNRYKDKNNIVWLTLGEAGGHLRKNTLPDNKIAALVKGIRDGDTGDKLLTIHADYKRGTSITSDGDLCDFNNWQTSQWCCINDLPRKDDRKWSVWEAIGYDYNRMYNGKPKPTLDAEAWYENNKDFCGAGAFNIRRRAYFTILAGAFGHTYGAGGIWDGLSTKEGCSGTAIDAIHYPGARDMGYVSNFFHALGDDFLKLCPDQSIITEGKSDDYDTHIQASIANDSTFTIIYSASDAPYSVNLSKLTGRRLTVIWYNPRTNTYHADNPMRLSNRKKTNKFDPPGEEGPGHDWVLVLGQRQIVEKFDLRLD